MTVPFGQAVETYDCFTQYNESLSCANCKLATRCRAITISDGVDVVAAAIDELIDNLPSGSYADTDRVSLMVTQLLEGGLGTIQENRKAVLDALKNKGISRRL